MVGFNEERRQILDMLAQGKINAAEAERLLAAIEKTTQNIDAGESKRQPKYLRILVESDESHHGHGAGPTKVNIRVPMQLLRAGVKLASLIPVQARDHINQAFREHGIQADVSQIKPENLEELIEHLTDLTVDVDETNNKVKIFCE